jgi:hypothetical protein
MVNKPEEKKEETVKGTFKLINGESYVQLDGSNIYTPVTSTVEAEDGDRVNVLLKDHAALLTSNITSPSARNKDVTALRDEVDEQGNTIQQMDNSIKQQGNSIIQINNAINEQNNIINAHGNRIDAQDNIIQQHGNVIQQHGDDITSMNNTIVSQGNSISQMNDTITSQGNTITAHDNRITANENNITAQGNTIVAHGTTLETFNSNIQILNSAFVIHDGVMEGLAQIIVNDLTTNHLNTVYANIDFSNIQMAAVTKLFTDSGIIKDLIVQEGKITGELVGVTIKGDLIEGNTIVADKLVIKGSNGLYYKLNTNGETVASEQTNQNSLNGSIITAHSITADRIQVTDLVAFGATIGGYHIDTHSLYSGVKSSVDNSTAGVFLGDDGQMAIGDNENYIKFYKDQNDEFKLDISADSIKFGSSSKTIQEEMNEIREETTTLLQLESSNGLVFKENQVNTVLSVAIYRGSDRITDMTTLKSKMGNNVRLQWKWKRMNDSDYGIISSSDSRISNEGFTFTLSPADVDTKVTFLCELII